MKETCRKLCLPLLVLFEKGEVAQSYKSSHRTILAAVGWLFLVLFLVALFAAIVSMQLAAIIPALVFGAVSKVCLVVSWLGSDVAVSRIWGLK